MKYKKELAARIVELIEHDLYGISEICKILQISRKTFYEWKKTKPEFDEAVEEAVNHREEVLIASARMGLKQLLEGYVQKEERITYVPNKNNPGNDMEKNRIVKKKFCPPDLGAIKYILERSEKAKEKQQTEQKRPLIIEVPDEETKRQLMIFRKNDFRTGGAENPEIVEAVDKELEDERLVKRKLLQKTEKKENTRHNNYETKEERTADNSSSYQCLPPGYLRRE
ncbi:helix-turn-helix domain-containing protein [Prevotella sp. 10(H)]|uniref:helix-turn-helix domain-containing protein n=1 Tax=Prevotella sp. 10(H) TaxID=1158294 RepID=UPI00068E878A|nr:helix-turn-helix domain-containing protein [Prevotella sp. 10(H)]